MEATWFDKNRSSKSEIDVEAHAVSISKQIKQSSDLTALDIEIETDPHVAARAGRKQERSSHLHQHPTDTEQGRLLRPPSPRPRPIGLPTGPHDLASALTGGFAKDIGISQSDVNLGNQLMFMGIVVFEIPCNMALQRLGPRKWISAQVFVFGTIATLQVFVKNRIGFLMARLFLGFAEAGYIPGTAYTLSNWYTRRKLAKRMSIFFFGMFGGNAISPLLASGILELHDKRSPQDPKPLFGRGIVRFTIEERHNLEATLHSDDPDKSFDQSIDFKLVWKTVSHYRRWPHFVSTFVVFSTWSPLITYTPSIIMSLGFKRLSAKALAAVGASLSLLVVFVFGMISDRTNRRGASVIAAQTCYLVVLIIAREVHPHVGKWSRFGLWTTVNAFAVGYHPIHNTWVQLSCREARERSIAIAMWVMSAISGLMVGTQYFRGNDTPFYHTGLRTMIIMVSVGIVFAALQLVIYVVHNRRVAKLEDGEKSDDRRLYYTP